MIVTVLGGGNGAFATAADLALNGHRVRLWRRTGTELTAIRESGGITLIAEVGQDTGRLEAATANMDDALAGAEVIVVAVPATAHDDIGGALGKRLHGDHIVLFTPGTLGAYAVARDIARAGGTLPLAFAETGTLPYLARKTAPATVAVPVRAANLPIGVFPAWRTAEVVERLGALYPTLRPCVDVLDVALTNAGPVIHPPLVLLNAGAIDGGRFDIHAAGTTQSVRSLIDAVDAERLAARRGWGYPQPDYELATYYDEARAHEGLYGAGAKARLVASGLWSEVLTFEHRYVSEDAALGLALLESAARTIGAATPASGGLLRIFGVLLSRQLLGRGRALEHLGLGDFAVREIRALLYEGWGSAMWSRVIR
ncbi:MAG: glycerol-3-phosphate dehydrogenase [Candidatus Rokuibacteriota bacterium]|nr:MAG: glycerol-3-phosphate dehydrogenase [Candidatus Rokubacteria bacterium]